MTIPQQNPTHYLVLDFEATCDSPNQLLPQEIIEFPVQAVDLTTLTVVAEYHQFVRPVQNPALTKFCTQLTGIQQQQVDAAKPLPEVLKDFDTWMVEHGFAAAPRQAAGDAAAADGTDGCAVSAASATALARTPLFVTCGDWDLKHLHREAAGKGMPPLPPYFCTFCNIKMVNSEWHAAATGSRCRLRGDMMEMLQQLGLTHVGHHHSGRDDVVNIGNITCELARRGARVRATGTFVDGQFVRLPL